MFRAVSTRRTFEEAVEQIAEAIKVGDMHAGARLPSERDLARQMGISRPTLREAIKVLADAGVVEVRPGPGGGMYVRSELVPRTLLAERSELRIGEVSGVLEARRLLEPRVAQLAGLYGADEDFDAMQRTIDLQLEYGDDRDSFLQLDMRFHLAIARATRNATIVSMMRYLLKRLEIARDMAIREPYEPEHAIGIHERTLGAIKSGDPDEIDRAMDEHLAFLEQIWEEESGRARLRRVPDFLLPHAERTAS
jgi:GntR family transcriptional regulator, transcriptional repressor for pyruvate dehydrogenase complex